MGDVVDDLVAEQVALDELVAPLPEERWETATPADGWTVRDQIAHLAYFDEVAQESLAGRGEERFRAIAAVYQSNPTEVEKPGEGLTGAQVLAWWRAARAGQAEAFRAVDPSVRVPWGPNHMAVRSLCTARLMETFAHGLDCFDALGARPVDTARLLHVCRIAYRALPYAFKAGGTEMLGPLDQLRVELTSPGGDLWLLGPEDAPQLIVGDAGEFARVGVRRLARSDARSLHAHGPLADAALDVLKAYL
ncbi:MAG: maleylpyruvate isomerase family mycothiol-dependent enzyme [Acidimicrobiales bacterium]